MVGRAWCFPSLAFSYVVKQMLWHPGPQVVFIDESGFSPHLPVHERLRRRFVENVSFLGSLIDTLPSLPHPVVVIGGGAKKKETVITRRPALSTAHSVVRAGWRCSRATAVPRSSPGSEQ